MRRPSCRATIFAGAWLLCLVHAAVALTPLEQTRKVLQQARAIVDTEQPHNQKLVELATLLKDFLDTDAMGRQALDQHWSKFSPAQQKEFLLLFRELFQRTYVQKLLLFEKPDFAYVGEQISGNTARADTQILTPRDEFMVSYQLRPDGDQWRATDIKIEDMSLTMNFRRQLDRLLSKQSPEELLSRMRKKYGPGGSGGEDDL
jgi:phospholipid transport system substrate-binding protein